MQGSLLQVDIAQIIVDEADEPDSLVDLFYFDHLAEDLAPASLRAPPTPSGDGGGTVGRWQQGKMRNALIEVVSYCPLELLPTAETATWRDQVILANKKPIIHKKGLAPTSRTLLPPLTSG